jgi:predicted HD superfamily hydrolase involved in NAD metabolism
MIYYCSAFAPFTTQHAADITKLRTTHDNVTLLFLDDTFELEETASYFAEIFNVLGFELPYMQVTKTALHVIDETIYFDGLLTEILRDEFPHATFCPRTIVYGYETLLFTQTHVFDDVAPNIAHFIIQRQLFGVTAQMERVYENMSYGRFQHTMRVRYLITQLAHIHQLDVRAAQFAALFHDYAKELPADELRTMMNRDFSAYNDAPEPAWHGFAAATLIEDFYGLSVRDNGVYEAIAFHSIGVAGYGDIGLALFIADFCDYRRAFAAQTLKVWELAQTSLVAAALAKIEHLRHYFGTKQLTTYRTTEEMAAWLLTKR